MNPSTRRYLPIVGVVVLLLVVLKFSNVLPTGAASQAGCAGASGQLEGAENVLGTSTPDIVNSVRAVATFDLEDAGQTASLEDLKTTIADAGQDALPALFDNLESDGFCMQAGATDVLDLIQIVGTQPDFKNDHLGDELGGILGVISNKLVKVATYALNNAGADDPDTEMQEASHPIDENKPEPEMQAVEAGTQQERNFDCAQKALEVVQGLAASEQADLDEILAKTNDELLDLDPASPAAMELVNLLAALAPEDEEWAKNFEGYAADSNIHKDAQGAACDAAVTRGSKLTMLRENMDQVTSPSVGVCLVEASGDWGDDTDDETDYAAWGLKNSEEDVRLASIAAFGSTGGSNDVAVLLGHLFSEDDPNGISVTETERHATIAAIAALVKNSDDEAGELLAGAAALADKLGPEGADWYAQLGQVIPELHEAEEDK